jgi:ech hydrogenase subunit D
MLPDTHNKWIPAFAGMTMSKGIIMGKQEIIDIKIDELVAKAKEMMAGHWRLVQICAAKLELLELSYSFGKEHDLTTLRIVLPSSDVEVPSITDVYFAAFGYENELHDLFGINVKGNAIDYKGNFYTMAVKTPFNSEPPSEPPKV